MFSEINWNTPSKVSQCRFQGGHVEHAEKEVERSAAVAQRLGNYVPKSGGYANTNIDGVRSTPYTQDLAENLEIASTLKMHDYGT